MKVNIEKRVLLMFILFLTLSFTGKAPIIPEHISKPLIDKQIKQIKLDIEWENTYEMVIISIKHREGFVDHPYHCSAGVLTIGYGHVIKKNEFFCLPMEEEIADSFLRQDLDSAIAYVQRTTNLKHLQLLAMAHLVYNIGSGNFYRSTLRQLILEDKPIDKEIVKWIHVKTKEGIIKSDWLLQSRKIELELYKQMT